MVASTMKVLGL